MQFVTSHGPYLVKFPVRQFIELQQKLLQNSLVTLDQSHLQPRLLDLRHPQIIQQSLREQTVRLFLQQPSRLTGEQSTISLSPPKELDRKTFLLLVLHRFALASLRPPYPPQLLQRDPFITSQHDFSQSVGTFARFLLAQIGHHRQTDSHQRPRVDHQSQHDRRHHCLLPADLGQPFSNGGGRRGGGQELGHAYVPKYLRAVRGWRVESPGSSAGQSVGLMSQRSRVRSPPRAFLFPASHTPLDEAFEEKMQEMKQILQRGTKQKGISFIYKYERKQEVYLKYSIQL